MSGPGSYTDALAGHVRAQGRRFALVAARFNARHAEVLLERARATLLEYGAVDDDLRVLRVPGAWELPQAVARVAASGRFDAVVAIGCVIRGETPHFDVIVEECARGLGEVALRSGVPVILGVLTTDTEAQARERASPEGQDKGREAALAAMEMASLFDVAPGEGS